MTTEVSLEKGSAPVSADTLIATLNTVGVTTDGHVASLLDTVTGLVDGADPAILSDDDPEDVAVAADPGALTTVSRSDHVHALGTVAAHIAALGQTTSNPPTQAQVQAIATKVDAILTALINAGLMAAS